MLRKRPASPLLLSVALLITSIFASSTPSPSASPHSPTHQPSVLNPRLYNPNEVYDDDDDLSSIEVTRKPGGSPPPPCQYDICRDQQESCQKLALVLLCSCPGTSGPFDLPDPPSLYSLSLESRGMVVVRWCEPPSTVTQYRVHVEGEGEEREASENRRMMELGDLAPGTQVCVKAVNKAGVSTPDRKSCARFESSSETRLAVKLVLIGAAAVLVIVIVLSLLVWWCRRRQKTPTRTPNEGTAGVL